MFTIMPSDPYYAEVDRLHQELALYTNPACHWLSGSVYSVISEMNGGGTGRETHGSGWNWIQEDMNVAIGSVAERLERILNPFAYFVFSLPSSPDNEMSNIEWGRIEDTFTPLGGDGLED